MDLSISPIFLYLASWFATMGGLWTLFDRAEKVATQEAKKRVFKWLKDISLEVNVAAESFTSAFDSIFGTKKFSSRFVMLSIAASLLAVASLTLLWSSKTPDDIDIGHRLRAMFLTAPLWNAIPDYFSLIETRIVLGYIISKNVKGNSILKWLAIDFIFTVVIFSIFYFGSSALLGEMDDAPRYFVDGFTLDGGWPDTPSVGVFFYSTFFTSIWLWLFVLSKIAITPLNKLLKLFKIIRGGLDIENQPFKSIGFISMILTSIVYGVMPFL